MRLADTSPWGVVLEMRKVDVKMVIGRLVVAVNSQLVPCYTKFLSDNSLKL